MDRFTLHSPMLGTIAAVSVAPGDVVSPGDEVVVIESMKMEHPVRVHVSGVVGAVAVGVGDTVNEGDELVSISAVDFEEAEFVDRAESLNEDNRDDLARYRARRHLVSDAARPDAVAKRHSKGRRTARENIDALIDAGSFVEYGAFAVAAQRSRREEHDLITNTPADGLVCGLATIDGAPIAVLAYDYTVLAGTQGFINHRKTDRLLEVVRRNRLPVVLFAEGGGGRPGDVDAPGVAGLDVTSFAAFAALSGVAPLVGIASGYCFAGNAALLGCCDVIIATDDANIGMAGPAMIEGGGLGVVAPSSIGPVEDQARNGVVDVRVADEREAVDVARQYLSYFSARETTPHRGDDTRLRTLVPEARTRIYDVRAVVAALADVNSLLELRPEFGAGIVTALARVHGRSVGLVANNPHHLGGAIDRDAADKMARFLQLCDAHGLPIVSLCDTPGFMVGVEAERNAQVRHFARIFVVAASVTVPWITVVLRKGYGLGAQAMAGGSFHAKDLIVSWPTGEFGGMGLEGAVRLGFRAELESAATDAERDALEERLIRAAYERGSALSMASHVEIDDVIDPATTPEMIRAMLVATADRARTGRTMIDPW
jgi:acetyl-CoA carboxylase carboxyltransferase component